MVATKYFFNTKKQIMNKFKSLALMAAIALFSNASFAQMDKMESKEKMGKMKMKGKKEKAVMVGGAAMYPSKNIVENAVNSKDHTTLVAAVKAAGLVETLQSAGPFTVFAPTNEAFNLLPAGTVDNLVKPESKKTLTTILTYHVVAGKLNASDIAQLIKAGNGTATLKTVAGET